MVNIGVNKNFFWQIHYSGSMVLYLKGYVYSHTVSSILEDVKKLREKDLKDFLKSLDGCFAIIVQKEEFTLIAVDKIRSTPLFFIKIGKDYHINYNPTELVDLAGFEKCIRDDAILEISMSGYTIGNKTVYKNLHSLKAGELVVFRNNSSKYHQYYKYFGNIEYKNYDHYIKELSEVTLNVFRKMLRQIGNRQIIIPLSAGNDSRLVASALKHLGASNVKCYSYGSIGNFEAKIAKIVAKKLEYEWIFIPLGYKSEKKYYASQEYKEYLKFAETYCSVAYTQSLSTIKYLKDMNWIDADAIFVNGNSGDFISGAHINALKKNNDTSKKQIVLNALIEKHFSLWGEAKSKENIKKIKSELWNEITLVCESSLKSEENHLLYEYSEFIDRQSKYVVSGQRAYEFYGYEWRMPLWDDEYLHFWQKIPAEFKNNQKLYTDMLKEQNFGKVWRDGVPVNMKNITPKWVSPARFLIKLFFGAFGTRGKLAWKQFDKVVFNYWMINTHTLKAFSYLRVLADFGKKPRGIYSCWASVDYISSLKKRK